MGLNMKVIGLMKDELGGEIMTEFVTLRPKMYEYKTGESEFKKSNRIKKCVVRKTISFKDYKAYKDYNLIQEMWVNHFETLGTPSNSENFDSNFLASITASVEDILKICSEDPAEALCTPLEYEEVAHVCSILKPGVSGISLDYEHIHFAGPTLWNHLFLLYQDFFQTHTVPENLKTGVILPLLKGKGAKANNKDNYRGITMFHTLCKIYEMILLNRLEVFAKQNWFFSEMQFGFQEGIGCIEASFTILETINHICLNGVVKFSVAFLMFVNLLTRYGLMACYTSYS